MMRMSGTVLLAVSLDSEQSDMRRGTVWISSGGHRIDNVDAATTCCDLRIVAENRIRIGQTIAF
jgi:hypothetical protein